LIHAARFGVDLLGISAPVDRVFSKLKILQAAEMN
jgi:hypothetical protein